MVAGHGYLDSGYKRVPGDGRSTTQTLRCAWEGALKDRADKPVCPEWIVAIPTARVHYPDPNIRGLWIHGGENMSFLSDTWDTVDMDTRNNKADGVEHLIPGHDLVVFDWRRKFAVILDIELIAALNEFKPKILVLTSSFDCNGLLKFLGLPTDTQPLRIIRYRGIFVETSAIKKTSRATITSDDAAFIKIVTKLDKKTEGAAEIWLDDVERVWPVRREHKMILVGTMRAARIVKKLVDTHGCRYWPREGHKLVRILKSVNDMRWFARCRANRMLIVSMDTVGGKPDVCSRIERLAKKHITTFVLQPPTTQLGVVAWKKIRSRSFSVVRIAWSLWMDLFFRWRRSHVGCEGALDLFNRIATESKVKNVQDSFSSDARSIPTERVGVS